MRLPAEAHHYGIGLPLFLARTLPYQACKNIPHANISRFPDAVQRETVHR
jgi:hypothetical protein